MKTRGKIAIFSILLLVLTAAAAFATDDGNTKPHLSSTTVVYGLGSPDIINQTSVTGNVKGVSCDFNSSLPPRIVFTVNGATAQTISLPNGFPDAYGYGHTGWIPMNIRFTSSIRVQAQFVGTGSGEADCYVSWALD